MPCGILYSRKKKTIVTGNKEWHDPKLRRTWRPVYGKRRGFGCCKCGRPVYQYHHIIDYAIEQHFRPEDMMILCPYCHDEATKAMPELEQRGHKANPYNIQRGMVSGSLEINHSECAVDLGTVRLAAMAI